MEASIKDSAIISDSSNKPKDDNMFKATKMWNEVLHAFYLGIELKKHRRNMKSHYDCFTASEAVTWLKNYLRKNEFFNSNKVTRFQALNLLRKYHASNIIERVNLDKNDLELKDNQELFHFTVDANENLPFLVTSKSDADLLQSCSNENFEPIPLNAREKADIYKRALWTRLNQNLYNIADYVKLENIDGSTVMNNVTRVNANGVVQLLDKNEDLPHWILSAMKCLASWPKAHGSGNCLPKYPGFESDVFNLIREYFTNMEEPIIPYDYYKLLLDVYTMGLEALSNSKKKLITAIKSTDVKDFSGELGLPSNCVYETAFSSKEPVTKIVPIDELSGIFPSLLDYFKQETTLSTSFSSSFKSPSISQCTTTNTFRALSTIPRATSRKKVAGKETAECKSSDMFREWRFESPPESSEYMLNKDVKLKRFYSLRKGNISDQSLANKHEMDSGEMAQYYETLRLSLLLLPNANRRHLQLLLRLFHKIIGNKELCLLTKDAIALKEHIVNIFTRCIIRSEQEKDFNEFRSKEFVSFLIDECLTIFKVSEEFIDEVEKMMTDLRDRKRQAPINDYCQKISNEEYELQRDALSDAALSDLLQSIMRDDSLSERDKLKWIKQFKSYHPDVYDIYFTTNCSSIIATKGSSAKNRERACSLGPPNFRPKRDLLKRFLSLKL